jgi:hypothetical protein
MMPLFVGSCKNTLENNSHCDWLKPIRLKYDETLILDRISSEQIVLINEKYDRDCK